MKDIGHKKSTAPSPNPFQITNFNDGMLKSNKMSNRMICQMTSEGQNQKKPSFQVHSDPSIPLVWFLPPPGPI